MVIGFRLLAKVLNAASLFFLCSEIYTNKVRFWIILITFPSQSGSPLPLHECSNLLVLVTLFSALMELPQLGHNALPIDRQLDPVPKLPKSSIQALRLSETVELPVDKTAFLDPKHVLATQGSAQLTTSEPEYDNRWLSLRRSHEYCFLPNELTIHEQGEGTILAVGVVTPTEDALENQKIRFTHDGPLVTSTEAIDLSTLPPVPKLAPEQLLRLWLTQLDKNNPGLSQATLVMRTLNPKSESTNSDPGHSDPTSHTDDENEPQTQAYRF